MRTYMNIFLTAVINCWRSELRYLMELILARLSCLVRLDDECKLKVMSKSSCDTSLVSPLRQNSCRAADFEDSDLL